MALQTPQPGGVTQTKPVTPISTATSGYRETQMLSGINHALSQIGETIHNDMREQALKDADASWATYVTYDEQGQMIPPTEVKTPGGPVYEKRVRENIEKQYLGTLTGTALTRMRTMAETAGADTPAFIKSFDSYAKETQDRAPAYLQSAVQGELARLKSYGIAEVGQAAQRESNKAKLETLQERIATDTFKMISENKSPAEVKAMIEAGWKDAPVHPDLQALKAKQGYQAYYVRYAGTAIAKGRMTEEQAMKEPGMTPTWSDAIKNEVRRIQGEDDYKIGRARFLEGVTAERVDKRFIDEMTVAQNNEKMAGVDNPNVVKTKPKDVLNKYVYDPSIPNKLKLDIIGRYQHMVGLTDNEKDRMQREKDRVTQNEVGELRRDMDKTAPGYSPEKAQRAQDRMQELAFEPASGDARDHNRRAFTYGAYREMMGQANQERIAEVVTANVNNPAITYPQFKDQYLASGGKLGPGAELDLIKAYSQIGSYDATLKADALKPINAALATFTHPDTPKQERAAALGVLKDNADAAVAQLNKVGPRYFSDQAAGQIVDTYAKAIASVKEADVKAMINWLEKTDATGTDPDTGQAINFAKVNDVVGMLNKVDPINGAKWRKWQEATLRPAVNQQGELKNNLIDEEGLHPYNRQLFAFSNQGALSPANYHVDLQMLEKGVLSTRMKQQFNGIGAQLEGMKDGVVPESVGFTVDLFKKARAVAADRSMTDVFDSKIDPKAWAQLDVLKNGNTTEAIAIGKRDILTASRIKSGTGFDPVSAKSIDDIKKNFNAIGEAIEDRGPLTELYNWANDDADRRDIRAKYSAAKGAMGKAVTWDMLGVDGQALFMANFEKWMPTTMQTNAANPQQRAAEMAFRDTMGALGNNGQGVLVVRPWYQGIIASSGGALTSMEDVRTVVHSLMMHKSPWIDPRYEASDGYFVKDYRGRSSYMLSNPNINNGYPLVAWQNLNDSPVEAQVSMVVSTILMQAATRREAAAKGTDGRPPSVSFGPFRAELSLDPLHMDTTMAKLAKMPLAWIGLGKMPKMDADGANALRYFGDWMDKSVSEPIQYPEGFQLHGHVSQTGAGSPIGDAMRKFGDTSFRNGEMAEALELIGAKPRSKDSTIVRRLGSWLVHGQDRRRAEDIESLSDNAVERTVLYTMTREEQDRWISSKRRTNFDRQLKAVQGNPTLQPAPVP